MILLKLEIITWFGNMFMGNNRSLLVTKERNFASSNVSLRHDYSRGRGEGRGVGVRGEG